MRPATTVGATAPTFHLIATSATHEGISGMIASYFYSGNIWVGEDGSVNNSTGALKSFRVVKKKGRYRFERIEAN